MTASDDSGRNRLAAVELDESIGSGLSADADHERRIAIYDLIEDNSFTVVGHRSPFAATALRKNSCAASMPRSARRSDPTDFPHLSTARYR